MIQGMYMKPTIDRLPTISSREYIHIAIKFKNFMAADKVKWRKPVLPGDVLQIDIELIKAGTKIGKAKAKCTVGQQIVSEAEITFALVDQN